MLTSKGATNMPWDELLQLALGSLEELEEYNALSSLSHKVNHVGLTIILAIPFERLNIISYE